MATLDGIAASLGLASFGPLGSLFVGVLLIFIVVKILNMPVSLVWNGLWGALMLCIVNFVGSFVGFSMKITVVKALIAGFLGVPGALAVIMFEMFG